MRSKSTKSSSKARPSAHRKTDLDTRKEKKHPEPCEAGSVIACQNSLFPVAEMSLRCLLSTNVPLY